MKYPELILEQMEIGPMNNFIYFVGDAKTGEIAVVDPAWDVDYLRAQTKKKGYTITKIFLTHGHHDHINGIPELQKTHDVPVYISKYEIEQYTPKCKNLNKVEDHAKLKVGDIEFECLYTPGHSLGCHCFKYKDILIAGDTLFIDGCGRVDLPGGDAKTLFKSLYNVVLNLPDTTIIYPGHNYGAVAFATLAEQKKTNPYLQTGDLENFLTERLG